MSHRRPRRRPGENRARLLAAGLIEFGLHGYHGAATSAIARRAEVPQPHLYTSFATKLDLFTACAAAAFDTVTSDVGTERESSERFSDSLRLVFQVVGALESAPVRDALDEPIRAFVATLGAGNIERLVGVAGHRLLSRALASPVT